MRDFYATHLQPWVLAYRELNPAPLSGRRRAPSAAVVTLAVGAATIAMSGVGYAYWATQGSGTGTVGNGLAAMSVTSASTPTGLYPGGPGQTMNVTLTNTGKGTINVTALTPGAATPTGCTATDITFTRSLSTPLPTALAATPATVTFTVAMDAKAESACAGQTFSVNFTASGTVG